MIDPRHLKLDPVLNGRVELPDVTKFEADFRNPKIGQIQPITVRKKSDGYAYIVDGVSRWRAALNVTKEKGGTFDDGVFMLRCRYFVGSDSDCFIATIKANIRNEPKPEDDAHNISILIHNFSMEEEDVAGRIYGRYTIDNKPDVKWLRDRLALCDLTPEGIEALKSGRLKPKAAVQLAKLAKDEQKALLKRQKDAPTIKASVPSESNGTAPKRLSTKAIVAFWKPQAEVKITPAMKPLERNVAILADLQIRLIEGGDQDDIWDEIRKLLKEKADD
jgi:ParB-like chromosome segregation protein Spo0J